MFVCVEEGVPICGYVSEYAFIQHVCANMCFCVCVCMGIHSCVRQSVCVCVCISLREHHFEVKHLVYVCA